MDINDVYVVNLVVINTVPINMINTITNIAFMRYKYMYLHTGAVQSTHYSHTNIAPSYVKKNVYAN